MELSRDEIERWMGRFVRTLREAGVKVTPQRMEIFREVARTDQHPDAETVYRRVRERMTTLSLDTVYRTLWLLVDHGLISTVGLHYERARFDGNTRRHHHLVCTGCGGIRDFYSEECDGLAPPREATSWGEITSAHVELRGLCNPCRNQHRPGTPRPK